MQRVTIDPLTRVEGRGRVELFLAESGELAEAYFVVPELRGFEQLCIGRPVEELPSLTARICGLCPEAHHMASVKALDVLFGVEPPPAARAIRELLYCSFVAADHVTHFFALAGPDFLLPRDTPADQRNLLGVYHALGPSMARRVVRSRVDNHELIQLLGGRSIHLVGGLPGGWSRPIEEAERSRIETVARANVELATDCLRLYIDHAHEQLDDDGLYSAQGLSFEVHSMGTVDRRTGRLALFDGTLRVVDPAGAELLRFPPENYRDHLDERVEPYTYLKLPYLKEKGWHGLTDGDASGVFAVGPLARLNACAGVGTPLAQKAYTELYTRLSEPAPDGGFRPIHNRLVNHWARLVEQLYAAERMLELASAPELTDSEVRAPVPKHPVVHDAVGCIEAPRGTLLHDYRVDDRGLVTGVNLIVGTTHNHAAIAMSVTGAARHLLTPGVAITETLLNRIEVAIRAHDPCLACATHTFPGGMPLEVVVRNASGEPIMTLRR